MLDIRSGVDVGVLGVPAGDAQEDRLALAVLGCVVPAGRARRGRVWRWDFDHDGVIGCVRFLVEAGGPDMRSGGLRRADRRSGYRCGRVAASQRSFWSAER